MALRVVKRLALLSVFSVISLVLYICIMSGKNILLSEPQKYLPGARPFPRDKILGSLITHVSHPERKERVIVAESDPGILVSVKTTTEYHKLRLSLLLFTWLMTLPPDQVYIITDHNADDIWINEAQKAGIHVVKPPCPTGHLMQTLCCKSGQEFKQYYTAIERGEKFRWFCHFDDDEYLNIGTLSQQLKTYNSSKDYYIGHWLAKLGEKPQAIGFFKNFPKAKKTRYFYATGASYCISAGLMKKVEKYFRGKAFMSTCKRIGLTDDVTIGSIIGGVMGIDLTEVSTMLSQGENFTQFNVMQLRNMITISSKEHRHNRIKIPNSPFSEAEDPTGFLSYHCLLYPQVNWCHNQTLHVYRSGHH